VLDLPFNPEDEAAYCSKTSVGFGLDGIIRQKIATAGASSDPIYLVFIQNVDDKVMLQV
jgi:hypothetical protein